MKELVSNRSVDSVCESVTQTGRSGRLCRVIGRRRPNLKYWTFIANICGQALTDGSVDWFVDSVCESVTQIVVIPALEPIPEEDRLRRVIVRLRPHQNNTSAHTYTEDVVSVGLILSSVSVRVKAGSALSAIQLCRLFESQFSYLLLIWCPNRPLMSCQVWPKLRRHKSRSAADIQVVDIHTESVQRMIAHTDGTRISSHSCLDVCAHKWQTLGMRW